VLRRQYRLLKSRDLITSPAFVVIKAANEFKDKTTMTTKDVAGTLEMAPTS
jgi:hypothetical protein